MDELDFDSEVNEKRFAPAKAFSPTSVEVDDELEKEIAKIPDKLAFKIGDVAEIVDVKAYVLRYWENEFSLLRPQKSKNNQRVYSKKDVETVLLIKKLLYRDRFSIEGANSVLKSLKKETKKVKVVRKAAEKFDESKADLQEILLDLRHLRESLA